MYLPELVPLPWRVLRAWERFSLARPRWFAPDPAVALNHGSVEARLIALGDVALIRPHENEQGRFYGIKTLLQAADVRVANLEAVITTRGQPALSRGTMRAEPATLESLEAARFDVVGAANNHALDYGTEGLAECLDRLGARGIGTCGVDSEDGRRRFAKRVVNSVRIGFLGYCDDINVAGAIGMPRPCLWSPQALAEISAARSEVDVLIVLLHWGYEFALHPLLRHRNEARRAVDAGAHAVICHHAHVPLGLEIWKGSPIVHGLGNGCIPINSYMTDGHPWSDRSLALEMGVARDGIATLRLHPLRLRADGSPELASGREAGAFLAGVAQMSARLGDDAFLDGCERARLAYEGSRLIDSLQGAVAEGEQALDAQVAKLRLPRQQGLLEFLELHDETASLARGLRALLAARSPAELRVLTQEHLSDLPAAKKGVKALYRWRDALRARLP